MKSLWFFTAFLAAVCCVIVPIYGQEKDSESTANKQGTENAASQLSTSAKENAPQSNSNDAQEQPQGYFHRLLSPENLPNIGLFVAGVIGIIVAIRTLKSINKQAGLMEGQLAEMQAAGRQTETQLELAHRPWVAVTPVIVTPLIIDSEGLRVTVRFFLKNIGKSPAFKTVIHSRLDSTWDRNAIQPNWKALCAKLEDDSMPLPNLVGVTLFPGEHFRHDITFTMTVQDIADALDPETHLSLRLTLMGCIDYQFSFVKGHHQTRFLYDLLRYTASSPFLQKIDVAMGTLPLKGENSLRLFRHIPSGSEAT